MARQTRLPLPHRQALNKTLVFTRGAPEAAAKAPAVFLRALRVALSMSQAQLAKRAGVAQSHVAAVESGRTDPQAGTLRRLFDAMHCDLLIIPKARRHPGEALAQRRLENPRNPWG